MSSSGRLNGKIALVTGAAQGIGEAIARKFAEHGAIVVIADIQQERGHQVAASIGENASFEALDVCDPESWARAIEAIVQRHGGMDVLVNNAGNGCGGPIEHQDVAQHRAIVNLESDDITLTRNRSF